MEQHKMGQLENYEKILKHSCLFRQKNKEEIKKLCSLLGGRIQDYGKGQLLLHEGDTVGQLGIVLEGEVRIVRIDMEGNERLFQKLVPSYMLGADVVCTPTRQSPYSAYCSQDAKVWYFDWMPGHEKWEEELERRLMAFIANENVRKFYRIDILSTKSVRMRVLKYLRIQCRKRGSDTVEIPYSREEMANYLCVNRSVLSDELGRMQEEGLITFRKNRFTLCEGVSSYNNR